MWGDTLFQISMIEAGVFVFVCGASSVDLCLEALLLNKVFVVGRSLLDLLVVAVEWG